MTDRNIWSVKICVLDIFVRDILCAIVLMSLLSLLVYHILMHLTIVHAKRLDFCTRIKTRIWIRKNQPDRRKWIRRRSSSFWIFHASTGFFCSRFTISCFFRIRIFRGHLDLIDYSPAVELMGRSRYIKCISECYRRRNSSKPSASSTQDTFLSLS